MNGKKAKKLRRAARFINNTENFYENEGRPTSWGYLPKKNIMSEDGEEILEVVVDKEKLAKLKDKTPHWRMKTFGGVTFFRYAKGETRVLGQCHRQLYQDSKRVLGGAA